MQRELVFDAIIDVYTAAIRLAHRDAKRGDVEAIEFLKSLGAPGDTGNTLKKGNNGHDQPSRCASCNGIPHPLCAGRCAER